MAGELSYVLDMSALTNSACLLSRPHVAEEVYVTGTFDNWSKSEKLEKVGDGFQKTVTLPVTTENIFYKVCSRLLLIHPFHFLGCLDQRTSAWSATQQRGTTGHGPRCGSLQTLELTHVSPWAACETLFSPKSIASQILCSEASMLLR